MKTMTVQVKFNAEKYGALLRYAKKKEICVEAELADTIDKLYKKLVRQMSEILLKKRNAVNRRKKNQK